MNGQDVILLARKQLQDLSPPYLWDDDELLIYLIDAQDKFVRVMGGISDSGSTGAGTALTDLSVTTDVPMATFSPYILRIRSAKLITEQRGIEIIDESQLSSMYVDNDYGLLKAAHLRDDDTGSVSCGIIGLEDNKLRWYKVPSSNDTCRLHVYRLPYPRMTAQEDDLEIDSQHHIHLIKWVKHMAYAKEDAETYDRDLSERNREQFENYCLMAKSEKERQRYKARVVRFNAGY